MPTLNHLCCILKNTLSCMHTCLTFIFLYILKILMLFMMVMVIILLIPITRFFYLDLKLLKFLFLNIVLMNHLPFLLKNHVSILLMKYVPILEMMVLNHDCAFPSKVTCSKSLFFYINDNEMDNVNKAGQRSSSMLSYGWKTHLMIKFFLGFWHRKFISNIFENENNAKDLGNVVCFASHK